MVGKQGVSQTGEVTAVYKLLEEIGRQIAVHGQFICMVLQSNAFINSRNHEEKR